MVLPKEVETLEEFHTELKNAGDRLVIVDFHATWCGPCKMIAPFLKELGTKYADIIILKVDVDELEDVSKEYEISAMPTFVAIKNEKKIDQLMGASKEKLEELLVKNK